MRQRVAIRRANPRRFERSSRCASFARAFGNYLQRSALAALLGLAMMVANVATAAQYEADAVKAAFLHRFAAYVEWPPASTEAAFTIAVIGADGVTEHLERLLPTLKIQNRRAQVRTINAPNELEGVHILYVGPAQAAQAQPIITAAIGRPILIVTDQSDGLSSGAVINFVPVERNVRFEVSLPAARRNGLQLSAGLLSVAVRVEDDHAQLKPAASSLKTAFAVDVLAAQMSFLESIEYDL
jgi:YfiR/HmsC-like